MFCIDAYCQHIFYIWGGGVYTVKSLDIFGVETQRVYQIIVTLSCSPENLLDFLEELYNIPTDLMFHWENIYKFEVLCETFVCGSLSTPVSKYVSPFTKVCILAQIKLHFNKERLFSWHFKEGEVWEVPPVCSCHMVFSPQEGSSETACTGQINLWLFPFGCMKAFNEYSFIWSVK